MDEGTRRRADGNVRVKTRGSRTVDASVDPVARDLRGKNDDVCYVKEKGRRRRAKNERDGRQAGAGGGRRMGSRSQVEQARVASLTKSMSWLECGPSSVCKQRGAGPMAG